jgi:hypothetical protein
MFGMDLIRHPVRWLRRREWFWPSAIRYGCVWVKDLFAHPLTAVVSGLFTIATILGLVFVVHLDALTGVLVALIVCLIIIARGARLKWKAERGTQTTLQSAVGGSPIYVQPQAGGTVNVFVGVPTQPLVFSEPNPGVNVGAVPGLEIVSGDSITAADVPMVEIQPPSDAPEGGAHEGSD